MQDKDARPRMDDDAQNAAKLRQLSSAIADARQREEAVPSMAKAKARAMSNAYRMVTELAACTLVGLLIGYWLDSAFDTRPWWMIVFFFLGFASGIYTLYKLASAEADAAGHDASPPSL